MKDLRPQEVDNSKIHTRSMVPGVRALASGIFELMSLCLRPLGWRRYDRVNEVRSSDAGSPRLPTIVGDHNGGPMPDGRLERASGHAASTASTPRGADIKSEQILEGVGDKLQGP
jgi:hypothetical protein